MASYSSMKTISRRAMHLGRTWAFKWIQSVPLRPLINTRTIHIDSILTPFTIHAFWAKKKL